MERFQRFCQAMDVKIDRIGRFLRIMETRAEYCKRESARYAARARRAQSKIERTQSMVLYYLASHDLKKISGDSSAAAGPVGRHASAGTDWKLNSELLPYSRSRGVFA